MRGDLAHGLPVVPGKEWLVRATESGCATRRRPNQHPSQRQPITACHARMFTERGRTSTSRNHLWPHLPVSLSPMSG
eukprot:211283-Prymnesium_polylepis.1